jgi:hypothetical protein
MADTTCRRDARLPCGRPTKSTDSLIAYVCVHTSSGEGINLHVWTQTQAASIFRNENRDKNMLETIAIVLLILWLLGMVSATTVGGFVHVLLVFAIIIILVRVIRGRK